MRGKLRVWPGDDFGDLPGSQALTHHTAGSPQPPGHRGLVVNGLTLLSSVVFETAGRENRVRTKWGPPHPLSVPCTGVSIPETSAMKVQGVHVELSRQCPEHCRGGRGKREV